MTELQKIVDDMAPAMESVTAGTEHMSEKVVRAVLLNVYAALRVIAGPVGDTEGDDTAEDVAEAVDAPKRKSGRRKAETAGV